MLGDMAILTGGEVISEKLGLKLDNADLSLLGKAAGRRDQDETTIVDGGGDAERIAGRVNQIRARSRRATRTTTRETPRAPGQAAGGVAVIKAVAATEWSSRSASTASKTRFVNAKRRGGGVVAGGGVALTQAGAGLIEGLGLDGDEAPARTSSRSLLEAPLKRSRSTRPLKWRVARRFAPAAGHGLNAATVSHVENLPIDAGIIDPAKVTRSALQNAASSRAVPHHQAVIARCDTGQAENQAGGADF